jgi:hypothetical protein
MSRTVKPSCPTKRAHVGKCTVAEDLVLYLLQQEILQKYEPRATVVPAELNFMDCPYMWPFCTQPLYAGAMPLMFNATVLNGMGLTGGIRCICICLLRFLTFQASRFRNQCMQVLKHSCSVFRALALGCLFPTTSFKKHLHLH